VRNLVGIAGKPHARTVVAVIGPKTAETALEFGLRVDVQPTHSSVPDLVEALASYAVELREKLAAMPAKQRTRTRGRTPCASSLAHGLQRIDSRVARARASTDQTIRNCYGDRSSQVVGNPVIRAAGGCNLHDRSDVPFGESVSPQNPCLL